MIPDEVHGKAIESDHLLIGVARIEGDAINGGQSTSCFLSNATNPLQSLLGMCRPHVVLAKVFERLQTIRRGPPPPKCLVRRRVFQGDDPHRAFHGMKIRCKRWRGEGALLEFGTVI